MKPTPQKILAALLLCLTFLFTSCGSAPSEPSSSDSTGESKPENLFKSSVSYNSYSPAEDIALPIGDGLSAISHTQIEKTLYIIDGAAAYSLNIETGEGARLFETAADSIASYGDTIYFLDSGSGEISLYSISGEKLDSFVCESLKGWTVLGYEVTDNYLVVLGFMQGDPAHKIITISKESKTVETEMDVKSYYNNTCSYTKDKVFITYISGNEDKLLYTFDAKSGKLEKQRKILSGAFQSYCSAACYNPKADTVILAVPFGADKISLVEYQLDSEDNTVLARLDCSEGLPLPLGGRYISVYENVVSALLGGNTYQCFDYNSPLQYITIAYTDTMGGTAGSSDLEKIIAGYESSHDVIVRTVVYSEDMGRLELKLMAGDKDIDLFSSSAIGEYKCIKSKTYVDLNKFDSLGKKISSNVFVDFAAKTEDGYFGIPYEVLYQFKADDSNPMPTSMIQNMSIQPQTGESAAIFQYCIENIDFEKGEYLDPDGDELYKALKYRYENPHGSDKKLYDFEFSMIQSSYLIMNPNSEKQQLAAEFLEYFFDAMNGDIVIDPILSTGTEISLPFLELNTVENVYLSWKVKPKEVIDTVISAYNKASSTDGSNKSLKALAKEAAQGLRMRMGE